MCELEGGASVWVCVCVCVPRMELHLVLITLNVHQTRPIPRAAREASKTASGLIYLHGGEII